MNSMLEGLTKEKHFFGGSRSLGWNQRRGKIGGILLLQETKTGRDRQVSFLREKQSPFKEEPQPFGVGFSRLKKGYQKTSKKQHLLRKAQKLRNLGEGGFLRGKRRSSFRGPTIDKPLWLEDTLLRSWRSGEHSGGSQLPTGCGSSGGEAYVCAAGGSWRSELGVLCRHLERLGFWLVAKKSFVMVFGWM